MKEHDIDSLIRETLSREDAEFHARLDEPSVLAQMVGVFGARHRWLNVLGAIFTLVFLALALYCAVRFLAAGVAVPEMLRWGAGLSFCLLAVWALKIWYWMEVQRNSLTREIKRLELQIATLAEELRGRRGGP
jgi:hypothetical protein